MPARFKRNIVVACCFGLIWASIQYTQGRITDWRILAVYLVVFVVVGAVLCWGVQELVNWYKRRQ